MSNTFGVTPLIPALANEVALEIFHHFVAIGWDGPFTLVLVCTACLMGVVDFGGLVALLLGRLRMTTTQAMEELASIGAETFPKDDGLATTEVTMARLCKSIKSLRCRPNPALMENRENTARGICIVSFDGGGPGSMSQLRILDEVMIRMGFKADLEVNELFPANYFDLMGGVGFGGLVALLLGRLRMTTTRAMEELASIGAETFPKDDDLVTTEVTMARLRNAIESMLERHGHSVDMKLRDSSGNRCKVVLFAATTDVMDHCHPFRTYRSPRKCLDCTLVDAACATMATPERFSSVAIGPWRRKQSFAGIPHGVDNPMREVLKEAQLIFGEKKPVSLVLSLGSGRRARLSDPDSHVTRHSRIHCDGVARDLQHQPGNIGEYLRLNVDKGLETIELEDWHKLGSIESYTDAYLEMNQITGYIDRAVRWLLQRNGTVTLGQMSGTNTDSVVKVHSESLEKYLAMEFKEMRNVVQQSRIEKITLVDAIGNNIPIPLEFCRTYNMLSDVISLYFKHRKAPGSDFVERGDYRLVHGSRRNVVGRMEWSSMEKVGLKVEMSMVLLTRNERKERCPRCHTWFEGRATDGWAQCLFCTCHFQIETRPDADNQANDTAQSDDDPLVKPSGAMSSMKESKSSEPPMRKCTGSRGEAMKLQFRLISVIHLLENNASQSPNFADNGCNPPDPFRPILEARLFMAHGSIAGADCEVHPTARLLYDLLPQHYRDVFKNCPMHPEKHLDFVKYLRHLSLNDLDKRNEPSSERDLIKTLGIPVSTEEGDKKKWQCGVVGCEYRGTLQHLVSHLRTKAHIGIPTFACTLDCKKLFHHSQDRDRHVKQKACLKSGLVGDAAEPRVSTRSPRGVQDAFAAVPKVKVKSRVNQQLPRGKEYQIPAQTSPQSTNHPEARKGVHYDPMSQAPGYYNLGIPYTSSVPPQAFGTPLHLTHAYNQTHSNIPTTQDGRAGMCPASHAPLTPDLFPTMSILPTNNGGMHAIVIANNNHIDSTADNFQPTSNPQFTPGSQPVKPEFIHPTSLTYGQPSFDIRGQDPGQSSTSHSANFAGDFYGDDASQRSHRTPQDSRQPPPYVGASNRPEAGGVTGIKKEKIKEEEQEMRVDSESGVVAMDVTP